MVRTRLDKVQSYFQLPAANITGRPESLPVRLSLSNLSLSNLWSKGSALILISESHYPCAVEPGNVLLICEARWLRSLFVTPGRLSPRIRIGQTRSTTVLCADVMRRERSLLLAYARTAYVRYYVQRNGLSPIIMQQSTSKN